MTRARLELTRDQILTYRRSVNALDERLPSGPAALRRAAWAGLQDSTPRAALHSIHARVHGTGPDTWEDPSLVQLWGPRFSAYVVAARDLAVFSLGRLPDAVAGRRRAEDTARRLDAYLDGRRIAYGEAGRGLGEHPNGLRYAAPTGTVLIRWDGAGQPIVWTVPPPDVDPVDARLELARRYLHIFGPATLAGFTQWAGIRPADGRAAFDALVGSLTAVRTPVGDAWILSRDEPTLGAPDGPAAFVRLLPSGDTYFLLQGADRELLVPDLGPPSCALDPPRLARRRARGWRDRRDVETRAGRRHDRVVAPALACAACGRGGGGCLTATARCPAARPGPLGRLTTACLPESPVAGGARVERYGTTQSDSRMARSTQTGGGIRATR